MTNIHKEAAIITAAISILIIVLALMVVFTPIVAVCLLAVAVTCGVIGLIYLLVLYALEIDDDDDGKIGA